MMTNAAKYGALSASAGKLAISWFFDENGSCVIEWNESNGPKVTPPSRTGFGSTLIENTLTYDLGGEVEIRYAETGVTARFVIPKRHLSEIAQGPSEAGLPSIAARPL